MYCEHQAIILKNDRFYWVQVLHYENWPNFLHPKNNHTIQIPIKSTISCGGKKPATIDSYNHCLIFLIFLLLYYYPQMMQNSKSLDKKEFL
jgi:hypothetical protein